MGYRAKKRCAKVAARAGYAGLRCELSAGHKGLHVVRSGPYRYRWREEEQGRSDDRKQQ